MDAHLLQSLDRWGSSLIAAGEARAETGDPWISCRMAAGKPILLAQMSVHLPAGLCTDGLVPWRQRDQNWGWFPSGSIMGQRLESTTWKFRLPGCKIWVSLTLGPCVSSSELGLQQRWAEVKSQGNFQIHCLQSDEALFWGTSVHDSFWTPWQMVLVAGSRPNGFLAKLLGEWSHFQASIQKQNQQISH